MSGTISQQNPDGSWSPAEPLGWQPGLDAEVYREAHGWRAEVFDRDVRLATLRSRTRLVLLARLSFRLRTLRRASSKTGGTPE